MKTGLWSNIKVNTNLYKVDFGSKLNKDTPGAGVWLNGYCMIFASALNVVFGYPVYAVYNSKLQEYVHYFCYIDNHYIDVRGIIDDRNMFFKEFDDIIDIESIKDDDVLVITNDELVGYRKFLEFVMCIRFIIKHLKWYKGVTC